MKFQHYDLGYRQSGEVIQITLSGNAANVRLMNSSDFSNYRAGRRHGYRGGLAKRSPINLAIPSSGHWHVAIDMQGLRGTVRSSVRTLPSALPPLREIPLSSMPSLVRDEPPEPGQEIERRFDVFISHASADKDEVVRPLAEALKGHGLEVWYDEFELKIGMSLRRTIDRGIASSRFGVVIMSEAFFGRGWPEYELDGIVTRSMGGDQVLLPVWHGVTKQQVVDYSPSLADKLARSTATHTVEDIAAEIAEVIQGSRAAA